MTPARRPALVACAAALAAAGVPAILALAAARQAQTLPPAPLGLDLYIPVPPDNPWSAPAAALGERLFFDRRLSADESISCASCHQPALAFTDGRARSHGVLNRQTARSAPSILNAGYATALFWDGRVTSLEQQVLEPITAPEEMGAALGTVLGRLNDDGEYRDAFRSTYGSLASESTLARALATFVRARRSAGSAFDRYAEGDITAISDDARAGLRVFQGRARCVECHFGPLFSDGRFHNTGVGWGGGDPGRYAVTGLEIDRGRFKTPSLRNIAVTPPYMHDGSLATIDDVVTFYAGGGRPNPGLDERIRPVMLSDEERRQLGAFLETLTSAEYAGAHRPSATTGRKPDPESP